jgi:hypothetical protein
MDTSDLYRAAISAGVFVGVCMALGGGAPMSTYATAAGVQVVASLGSNQVHSMLNMWPTATTSAVVTGGLYTAAQHFGLGDTNDVSNYAVSAGSEFAARTLDGMMQKKSLDVGVADAMDSEEEAY